MPIKLSDIAAEFGGRVVGDDQVEISGVAKMKKLKKARSRF